MYMFRGVTEATAGHLRESISANFALFALLTLPDSGRRPDRTPGTTTNASRLQQGSKRVKLCMTMP